MPVPRDEAALRAERRNELVAGLTLAAAVLAVGYASGVGHLLGGSPPPANAASAPPSSTLRILPTSAPALASTTSPAAASSASRRARRDEAGLPATTATPHPSMPLPTTGARAGCDPSLDAAILDPFWAHVQKGHLEESPSQQVADVLDVDRYVQTHTALVQAMTEPLQSVVDHSTDGAATLWMHLKRGHLEESPGQQVADALDVDRYVQTHSALIDALLTPLVDDVAGTC